MTNEEMNTLLELMSQLAEKLGKEYCEVVYE